MGKQLTVSRLQSQPLCWLPRRLAVRTEGLRAPHWRRRRCATQCCFQLPLALLGRDVFVVGVNLYPLGVLRSTLRGMPLEGRLCFHRGCPKMRLEIWLLCLGRGSAKTNLRLEAFGGSY